MNIKLKKICAYFLLLAFASLNSLSASSSAQGTTQNNTKKPAVETQLKNKTEHLPAHLKAEINTVDVSGQKATIAQGNVIKIAFAQNFSSKTAKVGDNVNFVLKNDLKTKEGTTLIPAGTKIIATVQDVKPIKSWNRNAQVLLSVGEIVLPDGTTGTLNAKVHSKNAVLKRSGWTATGKAALWTVGLFGVGAGLGAIIGAIAGSVGIGCLAIGMPVGGGLGLIIGSATKGLNYNAKKGKLIYIELTQDLDICY